MPNARKFARKPRRARAFAGPAVGRAQSALRKFRQGSALAVAITSLILLVAVPEPDTLAQTAGEGAGTLDATVTEATGFFRATSEWAADFVPKLALAAIILVLGYILNRLIGALLRTTFKNWSRAEAFSALIGVGIFFVSLGAAFSALAGDVRALLGSVGLVGLALSWALQAPIESFTGWILNSFRGYYGVGDRIEVGDVFGDVFRIDVLTTTVWQAGGPGQSVQAAQPTGALITFPNSEVLRANIINYTRDFPYVWDEVTIGIANDSDLRYSMDVIRGVAVRVFGESMKQPAEHYRKLLVDRGLPYEIKEMPSIFAYPAESWTQIVIRYLVQARERRKWATELYVALSEELRKPEYESRILSGYPRSQVELYRKEELT